LHSDAFDLHCDAGLHLIRPQPYERNVGHATSWRHVVAAAAAAADDDDDAYCPLIYSHFLTHVYDTYTVADTVLIIVGDCLANTVTVMLITLCLCRDMTRVAVVADAAMLLAWYTAISLARLLPCQHVAANLMLLLGYYCCCYLSMCVLQLGECCL